MGMDFLGARHNISMRLSGWCEIYQLGLEGGWCPRGAVFDNWGYEDADHSEERRDDYFTNSGQLIDEIDAEVLANAVEKMLPSIPDMVFVEFLPPGSMEPNAFKETIRRFIDICREGGVRIL